VRLKEAAMAAKEAEVVEEVVVKESVPAAEAAGEKSTPKEPDFMADLDKVLMDRLASKEKAAGDVLEDASVLGQGKPAKEEPAKKADEKPAAKEGDPEKPVEDQDDDGEGAPDEALIERAVRAGLSLADAMAVREGETLERIVGRLESAGADKSADGKSEKPPVDEDPLKDVPDLDPKDYGDEIVKTVNGLKSIVREQFKAISGLKAELAKSVDSRQGTWVDGEIAKLGKDYVDVFGEGNLAEMPAGKQRVAREKLMRHLEFVQSDAKAEGRSISKAEAFTLALNNAFGEKIKAVKGAAAAEAAAKRSQKALNAPRDTTGRFATDPGAQFGTEGDRAGDAVRELTEKFFSSE
jgi:hypothetical protein